MCNIYVFLWIMFLLESTMYYQYFDKSGTCEHKITQPTISIPLFSFQFLPLSYKFKLIVQLSPATAYNILLPGAPESVCKSAIH